MLARGQIALVRHAGLYFWLQVLLIVGIPVWTVGMMLVFDVPVREWSMPTWYVSVINPALFLVINLWVPHLTAASTLRRHPGMQGEVAVTADASGLTIAAAGSTRAIGWSAISRAVETREFLLIYQGPIFATFVPKAAFATPKALEDFRQALVDARRLAAARRVR